MSVSTLTKKPHLKFTPVKEPAAAPRLNQFQKDAKVLMGMLKIFAGGCTHTKSQNLEPHECKPCSEAFVKMAHKRLKIGTSDA